MRFLIILIIILSMGSVSNQNLLAGDQVEKEVSMATDLEPKQVVDLEELLMSQVVEQKALIRLLVKKKIFSKKEFLDMTEVVSKEVKPLSVRLPTPVEGR